MRLIIDLPEDTYEKIVDRILTVSDVDIICQAILDHEGEEKERPHGEWKHDQFGDFFKSVWCSNCGIQSGFEFPFCPNCGAPMTEEALRKYNGLKEGEKDGQV